MKKLLLSILALTLSAGLWAQANIVYHPKSSAVFCDQFGFNQECWEDLDSHTFYADNQCTQPLVLNDIVSYHPLVTPCFTATSGNIMSYTNYCSVSLGRGGDPRTGVFHVYGMNITNARLRIQSVNAGSLPQGMLDAIVVNYEYGEHSGQWKLVDPAEEGYHYIALPDLKYGDELKISCPPLQDDMAINVYIFLEYLSDNCGDAESVIPLTATDFVVSNNTAIYDGEAKTATVALREGITGAGEMVITYKQNSAEVASPTNAGQYDVYVSVAESEKCTAFEGKVGTLTISKATPTADLFIFTVPEDLEYDGNAKSATVTFNDQDGKLTGIGTITVKYNGSTEAPSAMGDYAVTIDVAEGVNYNAATALTADNWKFPIEYPWSKVKAAAIAEITTAREGIQNENLNNWIDGAINDIKNGGPDATPGIDEIKNQILTVINFFKDGKAEGKTELLGNMGTPCTDRTAVEVTDGTTTVTLYNATNVGYIKK